MAFKKKKKKFAVTSKNRVVQICLFVLWLRSDLDSWLMVDSVAGSLTHNCESSELKVFPAYKALALNLCGKYSVLRAFLAG